MYKPKVSVITVVKNDEKQIEKTIQSVTSQTYSNTEFVILDGQSTDNTLSIIRKYKAQIDLILSEKDNGVFQAMNKAIDVATGDWLIYMNAGDTFVDREVLSSSVNQFKEDSEIVYGDVFAVSDKGSQYIKADLEGRIYKEMPLCHQSLFVKRNVMKGMRFNTEYIVLADYCFLLNAYSNNLKFQHINIPVSNYQLGGFSYDNRLLMYIEGVKILMQFAKINPHINYEKSSYYINLRSTICSEYDKYLYQRPIKHLITAILYKIKNKLEFN